MSSFTSSYIFFKDISCLYIISQNKTTSTKSTKLLTMDYVLATLDFLVLLANIDAVSGGIKKKNTVLFS